MTKKNKKLHYHEQTLADQDYKDKLNEHDKEWLAQFNKEYYQGIYNESDREIHPEKFDEELKAMRSSRRKDAYDNPKADIISIEEELEYEEILELEKLYKINEREAFEILREQTKDMIVNKIDTLDNIISDFQRDSIKLFINARKNQ